MAGRPKKPTALKLLEGTAKQHPERLNEREPKLALARPPRPTWLLPAARKHWRPTLESLECMGVLTAVDGRAIGLLCNAMAEYIAAGQEVEEHGILIEMNEYNRHGEVVGSRFKANPAVAVRADSWRRVNLMLQQYGLTAASRAKVKTEKPEEVDEFEALLQRGRK